MIQRDEVQWIIMLSFSLLAFAPYLLPVHIPETAVVSNNWPSGVEGSLQVALPSTIAARSFMSIWCGFLLSSSALLFLELSKCYPFTDVEYNFRMDQCPSALFIALALGQLDLSLILLHHPSDFQVEAFGPVWFPLLQVTWWAFRPPGMPQISLGVDFLVCNQCAVQCVQIPCVNFSHCWWFVQHNIYIQVSPVSSGSDSSTQVSLMLHVISLAGSIPCSCFSCLLLIIDFALANSRSNSTSKGNQRAVSDQDVFLITYNWCKHCVCGTHCSFKVDKKSA